jgi:uncharacterized protein YegL
MAKNVTVKDVNKDLAEIIFVLDKSGSMWDVKSDTIGGFNQFVEDQKKLPGKAQFTFITFDTTYNKVTEGALLESVVPLNENTYNPGGGTALYDAVNRAIADTVERHNNTPTENVPGRVIMVVLTDGEENSSREVRDLKKISEMVKEREKLGWEVVFLGADLADWQGMGSGMGFSKMSNMSKADMAVNLKKMSNYTAVYRSNVVQVGTTLDSAVLDETMNMSEADLDKQMKDLQSDSEEEK